MRGAQLAVRAFDAQAPQIRAGRDLERLVEGALERPDRRARGDGDVVDADGVADVLLHEGDGTSHGTRGGAPAFDLLGIDERERGHERCDGLMHELSAHER